MGLQDLDRGSRLLRSITFGLLTWATTYAAAQAPSALQALRDTRVPGAPQALAYVDVLQRAGQPDRAELLRLGALSAHLARPNGAPAPTLVLRQLIDAGASLPAPGPGTAQAQAWQQAFNRHVQLQWYLPPAGLPPELAHLQAQLQPLAPGAWRMSASGQDRYLAIVQLLNRSPTPLPLTAFWLRLGHAGAVLDLDCAPPVEREAIAGRPGAVLVDPGERVAPGGQRPFICRAVAEPVWREVLARAAAGSPAAGDSMQLLPRHFDTPQGVLALTTALSDSAGVDAPAWARRFAADAGTARNAPAATTRAAAPADAPSRRAVYMALAALAAGVILALRMLMARLDGSDVGEVMFKGLRLGGVLLLAAVVLASDWAQRLLGAASDRSAQATIAAVRRATPLVEPASGGGGRLTTLAHAIDTVGIWGAAAIVTLVLFVAGRVLRRAGWSRGMVRAATALLLFLGAAATIGATWEAPSGEGWGRAAPLVIAAMILAAAMGIGLALAALEALHGLLDDADISWPGSVGSALRHALDFRGQATRAEFWGFAAFFVLVWCLTRIHARAWSTPVTLVLALPLAALAIRRLRAMDSRETWTVIAVIAAVAAEIWL